jgi:hypothetical protein
LYGEAWPLACDSYRARDSCRDSLDKDRNLEAWSVVGESEGAISNVENHSLARSNEPFLCFAGNFAGRIEG